MLQRRSFVGSLLASGLAPRAYAIAEASGVQASTFSVAPGDDKLQLFFADAAGRPYRSFERLTATLAARGQRLRWAMNAGMFEADGSPVGLLVVAGRGLAPLNRRGGHGNFYLQPNGVFYADADGFHIVESSRYAPTLAVRLATQSGPLLLQHGAIHPAFNAASSSRLTRNGVGLRGGEAVFVISEEPLNLHQFASYFRDHLHCSDALYFDGVVSSLHTAEPARSDARVLLGPLVGVID